MSKIVFGRDILEEERVYFCDYGRIVSACIIATMRSVGFTPGVIISTMIN